MHIPAIRPELVALYAFWHELCAGRAMPSRADVSIEALRPWLGNLALLSVIAGGADYFFRVHGTNLRDIAGDELTGRLLMTLPYEWVAALAAEYEQVVATRQPAFKPRSRSLSNDFMMIEKLLLPLSENGRDVDMILVGVYRVA